MGDPSLVGRDPTVAALPLDSRWREIGGAYFAPATSY